MSFENKQSSIPDLEAYKESLLVSISEYGVALEEITKQVEEAKKTSVDIDGLNTTLSDLIIKKDELEDTIKEMEYKVEVLDAGIASLVVTKEEKEILEKEISDLVISKKTLEDQVLVSENNLDEKTKLLESINISIASKNDEYAKLTSDYDGKMVELENNFVVRKGETEAEINSLITARNNTIMEVNAATTELNSVRDVLANANTSVEVAHNLILDLDEEYAKKKVDLDAELVTRAEAITIKEVDLNTREGNLSLAEAKLETDKANLRTIKTKLEQEIGSSINIDL